MKMNRIIISLFFVLHGASAVMVWRLYEDPGGSLLKYQTKGYQISKLTNGLGTAWQILLPQDNACITLDAGYLNVYQSFGPKPCSVSVSDAAVSVSFNAWYMTGQLNSTLDCCTGGSASYCNASNAGSFMITGSGNCRTSAWSQLSYNPPWALNGGRTGFVTQYQEGLVVVLLGGKNASSGQPLRDTWAQCLNGGCVSDRWYKGGDIPAGCDPLDLTSFSLDGHAYLVCPDPSSGIYTVYGIDSGTLRWEAVQLSLPPPPALPSVRYQSTQFAQLPYINLALQPQTQPQQAAMKGRDAAAARSGLRTQSGVSEFAVRGGCLVAFTGGPNVTTPNGLCVLHRSLDGISWTNWSTPLPSRTNAAIAGWALPGVSGDGLVIAGGVGLDGSYRGDAYGLSGEFCCATACDAVGNCDICNNHGTCVLGTDAGSSATCRCNPGWQGDMCTVVAPSPTSSVTPVPSGPPSSRDRSLIPGLPDTGGVALVVVASLLAACILIGVAWRVRSVRMYTPGVPKAGIGATPVGGAAAVRDFK